MAKENDCTDKILTESDTRAKLITPSIINAGWCESGILREYSYKADYEFTEGRVEFVGESVRRAARKSCDYLLYMPRSQTPLAVLEAKANNKAANEGLQQAIDYARDLHAPFAFASNGVGVVEFELATKKTREFSISEFPSPEDLKARFYQSKAYTKEQIALLETPYSLDKKAPRYYQANAINATLEAIAKGQRRVLLEMATGTGKTYTAFQIAYRLHEAKRVKRILFIADRVNLIEQSKDGDFADFKGIYHIQNRKINRAYVMYFSTYQQLIEGGGEQPLIEHYKEFLEPDFFDLIIIDECHRSSRKDEGSWKEILRYFESAIHLGLTATPINKIDGDNVKYFCTQNAEQPHFTYRIEQGIADGFLAPYKVIRHNLNIVNDGVTLPQGKRDIYGNEISEDFIKTYYASDFNAKIRIKEHIELVAREITDFLKNTLQNRYAKTIVFCQDQEHAADIRDALNNFNADLNCENYAVRITASEGELGKDFLSDFISLDKQTPVIATTSKLLTTGVDSKMVQLIVIAQNISSPSEFTQIIGRGTRLNKDLESRGKSYFVIMDFAGATRLFGVEEDKNKVFPKPKSKTPSKNKRKSIRIDGIEVLIDSTEHKVIGEDGKLISSDFVAYSKDNLTKHYSLKEFLDKWHSGERKAELLDEFENQGILINEIRSRAEFENLDEFDILLKIAYDKGTLTRRERAAKAGKMLEKYEGKAREILEILLEKYTKRGISEIENPEVFTTAPLNFLNSTQAVSHFGGAQDYLNAIKELKELLYDEVA